MAKQAVKLSEYPIMPTNDKGEILYQSFFYTYANTNYGARVLRKNYQVPLDVLREDITQYIGLRNKGVKMLNFWWGNWNDTDRVYSYIYEWELKDALLPEYVEDKFGELKDPYKPTNSFILKTAPLPGDELIDVYENEAFPDQQERNLKTRGVDPNPDTTKIVAKDYVDERFKGFRKLYVNSLDPTKQTQHRGIWEQSNGCLKIRPYTCYYIFDEIVRAKSGSDNPVINIVDNNYELLKDIFGQKLTIFICLKDNENYYKAHPVSFLLDNESCNITWSYENEWEELYSKQPKDANGFYTIKLEIEIQKDEFSTASIPYKYAARAYSSTSKSATFDGNNRKIVALTPSPISSPESGETYNISFGDFNEKKDYFINLVNVVEDTIISFNVEEIGTAQQGNLYSWNFVIQTGNHVPSICFGGELDEIFWSMEDSTCYQPILQPNKLYTINFAKVLNENGSSYATKLIAYVKSAVSLVKAPVVDYNVTTTTENQIVSPVMSAPAAGDTQNYNCKIKWGDGSHQTAFYNGLTIPSHSYETPGDYTITVLGRFDGLLGFA